MPQKVRLRSLLKPFVRRTAALDDSRRRLLTAPSLISSICTSMSFVQRPSQGARRCRREGGDGRDRRAPPQQQASRPQSVAFPRGRQKLFDRRSIFAGGNGGGAVPCGLWGASSDPPSQCDPAAMEPKGVRGRSLRNPGRILPMPPSDSLRPVRHYEVTKAPLHISGRLPLHLGGIGEPISCRRRL